MRRRVSSAGFSTNRVRGSRSANTLPLAEAFAILWLVVTFPVSWPIRRAGLLLGLLVFALLRFLHGRRNSAAVMGVFGVLFLLWFLLTNQVPRDFTSMTPYVATLLVLASPEFIVMK